MPEPNFADAADAWRSGRHVDAERLARAVIGLEPHHVDAHRLLQEIFTSANRFPAAIEVARRVVDLAPREAAARRRLAELLSRGGDAAAAVAMLETSLQIEPDNARALSNLGNLLPGLGRIDEAIDMLRRALILQPDYPAAWVNLGVAYARNGNCDKSIGCYQSALALRPQFPEALLNLATAYMRLDKLEAALCACDSLLAQPTSPAGARGLRATILLALHRLPEAILAAKEATAVDPNDVQAWVTLGFAALRSGALAPALSAFDTATRHTPTLAKAHAGRANTLEALGRAREAIDAYHEAVRLNPTDPHVFLKDSFVFCCFNGPYKITPEVFDSWMRILHDAPAAVLWLREGPAAMQVNLAREAGARGVDRARLIYAPRVASVQEHRARFALADVFLDTAPYNAHTTACEALAAAVPVITRRGRTFASRVATSLLHAVGLSHLSVEEPLTYEQLAINLAHSPAAVAELKAHLRQVRNSASLFDTVRFCRHFEDALLQVGDRQRRGERPYSLRIEPLRFVVQT